MLTVILFVVASCSAFSAYLARKIAKEIWTNASYSHLRHEREKGELEANRLLLIFWASLLAAIISLLALAATYLHLY